MVDLELLTLILELQSKSVLPHPGNFSYHVQIIYDRVIFLFTKDTQALILIWIPCNTINKRKLDVQWRSPNIIKGSNEIDILI